MLSRHNSDAAKRLRRAKSSSSNHLRAAERGKPNSFDSQVAREHALKAANIAYEHIRSGSEIEMQKEELRMLRKRQSVRFAGPNAVPTGQRPITRTEAIRFDSVSPQRQVQPYTPNLRRSQSSITALPVIDSTKRSRSPFAGHRIRKARSMLSPMVLRKSPSSEFSTSTGYLRQSVRSKPSEMDGVSAQSRSPVHQSHLTQSEKNAAIELARDQYLSQVQNQSLKPQPSIMTLGGHRKTKSQKSFKKTVRSSSIGTYGPAISSSAETVVINRPSSGLKMSLGSLKLKEKFRKVFHRGTNSKTGIPSQHIDALRPHFDDYSKGSDDYADGKILEGTPRPRPSIENSSRLQVPRYGEPRPASIRSAASQDTFVTKSRVTSWNDSEAANTIQRLNARDNLRLASIQENREHQKPVALDKGNNEFRRSYTAFKDPMRASSGDEGPVDSQRIFSALRKKMDDDKRGGSNVIGAHRRLSRKISDWAFRRSSGEEPMKRVPGNSIRVIGKTSTEIPAPKPIRPSGSLQLTRLSSQCYEDTMFESPNFRILSHNSPKETEHLTYQQIAERNERSPESPRRRLREAKSLFFPASTGLQPRHTSPPRLSTLEGDRMKADQNAQHSIPSYGRTRFAGLGVDQHKEQLSTIGESVDSGSIYSRDTNGTPKGYRDISSCMSDNSMERGTALIEPPVTIVGKRNGVIDPPAARVLRALSSTLRTSGEWRGWYDKTFSSQVGANDRLSTETASTDHHRELAQIHEQDSSMDEDEALHFKQDNPWSLTAGRYPPQRFGDRNGVRHPSQIEQIPPLRMASNHSPISWNRRPTDGSRINDENIRYSYSDFSRPYDLPQAASSSPRPSETSSFETPRASKQAPSAIRPLSPPLNNNHARLHWAQALKAQNGSRHSPEERELRLRRMKSRSDKGLRRQHQLQQQSAEERVLTTITGSNEQMGGCQNAQMESPAGKLMVEDFLRRSRGERLSSNPWEGSRDEDPAFI